jgi:GT2 family glycosyltransferase
MLELSVLVCSTHTRRHTFAPKIMDQLYGQWDALSEEDRDRVEIMVLTDNKQMMLGEKRNVMVDAARGRYVQFVDDDDRVADDMLGAVLAAIDQDGPDVVTFLASVSLDGGPPKPCSYRLQWPRDQNTPAEYRRLPNHLCAVRRDLALQAPYPALPYREDSAYSRLLRPLLTTEHHIPRVLYHYDYNAATTEAQTNRPVAARPRRQPPVVDVVMLSKAPDVRTRRMTQAAIDSCHTGAGALPIRIVVVEQAAGVTYHNAETVHRPGPFSYNQFANAAAATGTAPWIVIANNDLVFEPGWLHPLITADHELVSPHNPGDPRQKDLPPDGETGRENGRHLSGWCYLISRRLWEEIGGLDEEFAFWCADDAVIEQCVAAGVEPMVLPDSRVRHIGSATFRREGRTDAATWALVARFNRKYGRDKFIRHPGYRAYLRRARV